MKLKLALEDKLMDTRLVDRFIAEGKLTKADYDKYLESIQDDEGNFERVTDGRNSSATE
ncbi:MAG: hypothetical protein VYA54_00420 [Bdellovibrionota bacterium]|nr:hypothetical protein [Bdellovibrionota bacterium]